MVEPISGVYKITNPLGKVYVGSSKNIRSRQSTYKNKCSSTQTLLYRSIEKYGWDTHVFEIIAIVEPEKRHKWEHILGMYYNVLDKDKGLNCRLPSYDDIPAEIRQETKDKIRKSATGRYPNAETRLKQSLAKRGKKISEERRLQLIKELTGRKRSKESIEKGAQKLRKKIINTQTNVIYNSIKETIKVEGYSEVHLQKMLTGKRPNKTFLKYVDHDTQNPPNLNSFKYQIINTKTNQIFNTIKEAAESVGMKAPTLSQQLRGKFKNKTDLKFVKDENIKNLLYNKDLHNLLNTETNEVFYSINAASKSLGIHFQILFDKINGYFINNTPIIIIQK